MQRLWAPWRLKYIKKLKDKSKGCVFCKLIKENKDRKNYIFARTKYSYAVLNIYPYNNGHALIVPYKHVSNLAKLDKQQKEDLFSLLESTQRLIDKVLRPNGYNIGLNIGRIAGAGFPGHLHIHLVPRWAGDMNFMPIIGNTKVMSQSLSALFNRLKNANKKRN